MAYLLCDGTTPSLLALQHGVVVERTLIDFWPSLTFALVDKFYPTTNKTKQMNKQK